MFKTTLRCCLLLMIGSRLVQGQRISQIKCEEYRNDTLTTRIAIPLTLDPVAQSINSFVCTKSVQLIVGGEDAKEGEFPHQALLGWKSEDNLEEYDFRCGGSLISDRFILTAAHCMKYGRPVIVRMAESDLRNEYDDAVDFEIENITSHPSYKNAFSYYDIALIKLKEEVMFSRLIRPACLWTGFDVNVTSVIASGFGHTESQSDKKPDVLRKVQLDFLDTSECTSQFLGLRNFRRGIVDDQLCIGSKREGRDTCQGDSGGPIQVITEPEGCIYHLIGITSVGASCGIGRSPSIYTRVASYLDWIEGIVWK